MSVEYIASNGEKVVIPEKINPFSQLRISSSASPPETKKALMREISKPKRQDRALASLAYHMITSPGKYTKRGSMYSVSDSDIFTFAAMGHKKGVVDKIDRDTSLVNSVDECKRTVMYLAARGGFGDIVELLIQKEADVNHKQKDNSTPLHVAAYYNQSDIVAMLLAYGANSTLKNDHGNTSYGESSGQTRKVFDEFRRAPWESSVKYFYSFDLVKKKFIKTYRGTPIGFELVRDTSKLDSFTKDQWGSIEKTWEVAYHGTKLRYLKSILTHGLLPSGSKLPGGDKIIPPSGHIALDKTVGGIPKWAKAIFVSPSIMCASHGAYSEYCGSGDSQWCVVVKVYVNPSSYTEHASTATPKELPIRGEPSKLEYRIEKKIEDRPSTSQDWVRMFVYWLSAMEVDRNVVVKSILFISTKFRKKVRDYGLTHQDLKRLFDQ